MKIHVVWAQGWDAAPPKAVKNSRMWEALGEVVQWDEQSAVRQLGVEKTLLDKAVFPAMKADIILANAMLNLGGFAIGADMAPLDGLGLLRALLESERAGLGMVVYQTFKDEPYSGASYFPKDHPWLKLVVEKQRENVMAMVEPERRVSMVTGPWMWRSLMRYHYGLWMSTVRTVPAWIAFSQEPKTRGTFRPAWIDPGLNGDWLGVKKAAWQ